MGLGLGLVTLGLALMNFKTIKTWFSKASYEPANLMIDTLGVTGKVVGSWRNLAQGGEAANYSFEPALDKLAKLKPDYVRIDHIYDFYPIVSRDEAGKLKFSWLEFDRIIGEITKAGAKPFISLSYMPPVLGGGDITGVPQNYAEWQEVVKQTIEHVSGKSGLNLANVYFEVWNEPDLFGEWKTYGPKNYLTLYEYAARGAMEAKGVQAFKFGGPATTKLYDNWVTRFVEGVMAKNLRFDFFSWHHYTADLEDYVGDYQRYDELMRAYPDLILKVEPVMTEWGIDSAVSAAYDNRMSAAHLVTGIITVGPKIPKMFIFEFQDGKDPEGKEYWGRWGLLTHQDFGGKVKPRYQTIELLNRLGEEQLSVVGNGTIVKALAAKGVDGTVQVIVANYDVEGKQAETVPVAFRRVSPGVYNLTTEFVGRQPMKRKLVAENESLYYSLEMPPNDVALLELVKEE